MMDNVNTLLGQARARYTQRQLADQLNVSDRTVARWESGETACPTMLAPALRELLGLRPASGADDFRFIDLFAGIGGIRKGFEAHGGRCVFTSEWNKYAEKTYLTNFPDDQEESHTFVGDIQPFPADEIPDHDILLGGFPCQPFSIAGVSKKNSLGRLHGFEDATQGTLFFDVARIINAKRPAAFMLENVKNLRSHDKGRTFAVIMETLQEELGYEVHVKVIDAINFTPQHRERIIIVGFREPTDFSWEDLEIPPVGPKLDTILHRTDGTEPCPRMGPGPVLRSRERRGPAQVHPDPKPVGLPAGLRRQAQGRRQRLRLRLGPPDRDQPHPLGPVLQGRLGNPRRTGRHTSAPADTPRMRAPDGL